MRLPVFRALGGNIRAIIRGPFPLPGAVIKVNQA